MHHLYKVVNGQPLRRPGGITMPVFRGDGMVDVQSHLVDQVQWMVSGERPGDYDGDVELHHARRWTTPVTLDLYRESTGQSEFPDALAITSMTMCSRFLQWRNRVEPRRRQGPTTRRMRGNGSRGKWRLAPQHSARNKMQLCSCAMGPKPGMLPRCTSSRKRALLSSRC